MSVEDTIGFITLYAGVNFVPKNYLACDGQELPINQFQTLFAVLGDTYGGNGYTTFKLPDFRGRAVMHTGGMYRPGLMGGQEKVVLSNDEVPSHTHTFSVSAKDGGNQVATNGQSLAQPIISGRTPEIISNYENNATKTSALTDLSIDTQGQGGAHNNMQPYTCLKYIICIEGNFPARN